MNTQTFQARLSTLPQNRRESLTAIFRRAHDRVLPTPNRWPNPEASIGGYIGRARWDHIWEVTGPAREAFSIVSPRIKEYLEDSVEPIPSRVAWSMYMIGRAPSIASPSIIFCCEISEHRRQVRNTIRDSGILDGYPGIKTGHLPRPPDFNQLVPLGAGTQPLAHRSLGHAMTLTAQSNGSVCGSRLLISAKGIGSEAFSAAATIGGVLRLGKNYYYTTAAHAFSLALASTDFDERSSAKDDHDTDDDALSLDGNESVHKTSIFSSDEQNLTTFGSRSPLPSHNTVEGLAKSHYSEDGISRKNTMRGYETDRHLSFLAKLQELSLDPAGDLFMTSMLAERQEPGLDYALIEVPSTFHNMENVVTIGQSDNSVTIIQSVITSDPTDTEIVAVTTRGAITGRIWGTPVYASAQGPDTGRNSSTKMFKISLDGPLHRGDCGTWVIDAASGDLFGHVVLGSPGGKSALITPFSDIFDDMVRRGFDSPALPSAQDFIDDSRTSVTSIDVESEVEEPTDLLILPDKPNKQVLAEMETTMEESNLSSRNDPETLLPYTALSEVASENDLGTENMGGRVEDFGLSLAQRRLKPNWQQVKLGEASKIGIQSNSSSPRTPTTKQSMAKMLSSSSVPRDPDTKRSSGSLQSNSSFPRDSAKVRGLGSVQSNSSLPRDPATKKSLASIRSNSSLARDPLRQRSSGSLAQSSRPRSCIPLDIEPLDLLTQEPRDPAFRDVLFTLSNIPMKWENSELLGHVLKEIDLNAIYSAAGEESAHFISRARGIADDAKPEWSYQDCVVRALLKYFRKSFFTRVDKPSCDVCHSQLGTIPRGNVQPSPQERAMRAQSVELYQCAEENCQAYTRFPRYWDVWTLFVTRRGRTGESATCFGMLCRALGIRVRWVWNAENRVWTEVYSEHQRRWVHVDAHEIEWDNPLLYAETWGKRMSYCIAFSTDGVADVTRRYVRNFGHASSRRRCTEHELLRIMHEITRMRRMNMPNEELLRLEREDSAEAKELESYGASSRVEAS